MSKSTLLWLPAAFVLGGLIGRFGPAEELRAFQKAAERSESASAARSANGLDSFIRLANIPDAAKRPSRTAKADKADGDSGTNVTAGLPSFRWPPPGVCVTAAGFTLFTAPTAWKVFLPRCGRPDFHPNAWSLRMTVPAARLLCSFANPARAGQRGSPFFRPFI